eukprot:UN23427
MRRIMMSQSGCWISMKMTTNSKNIQYEKAHFLGFPYNNLFKIIFISFMHSIIAQVPQHQEALENSYICKSEVMAFQRDSEKSPLFKVVLSKDVQR